MRGAGQLDHLVIIEQLTETISATGGHTETWAEFAKAWAGKRDLRGREFFQAQAVQSEIGTAFRIRWCSAITTKMRVNDDGDLYGIEAIVEVGRREWIDLMCKRQGV